MKDTMPKIEVEYYPHPNAAEALQHLTDEELDWMYEELEKFFFNSAQLMVTTESFRERGQDKQEKPSSIAEVLFIPSDDDFPYGSLILYTDFQWNPQMIEDFRVRLSQHITKEIGTPLIPMYFNVLVYP